MPFTQSNTPQVAPAKAEPTVWHQDLWQRPKNAGNAHIDPVLRALDKEHWIYATDPFTQSTAAGNYRQSFFVPMTNMFWLSNLTAIRFVAATQVAGNKVGFISLRDNASDYRVLDNVPLNFLGNANFPYYRSILPMPYPFGAGGGFTVDIWWPAFTALTTGPCTVQFEGWKDYSL